MISLLRGINVGGHNLVRMDALREAYQSLGLRNPRTWLQSGNVAFETDETGLPALAARIEDALERTFGFRPAVILRTPAELEQVIAGNPFPGRDPAKLAVIFLATDPATPKLPATEEEWHLRGREMYIYYPNGMGRTKLTPAVLERALKTRGTARNWNTVNNLLKL